MPFVLQEAVIMLQDLALLVIIVLLVTDTLVQEVTIVPMELLVTLHILVFQVIIVLLEAPHILPILVQLATIAPQVALLQISVTADIIV